MFDTDRFIADCRRAGGAGGPSGVLEVVCTAVTAPGEILHALGEPRRAGVNVLYRSAELAIFNLIWGQMCKLPLTNGCGPSSASTRAARTTFSGGGQRVIQLVGSRPLEPKRSVSGRRCRSAPTSSTPSSIPSVG